MDKIINFSECPRAHVSFGGTDRKIGVIYDNSIYMIKFPQKHEKKTDMSSSYVNSVLSEYVCSHISASIGLPTHETLLGMYNGEIVVGCKDFRTSPNMHNIEFSEYVHAAYDSSDINRLIRLDQIYNTLRDEANGIPASLQDEMIARYWDTFVVDALVGNFDRHVGNWGFLSINNQLSLAPVYDFGSSLFPRASEEGMKTFLESPYKMHERALVFPSPSLVITDEKVGKVGYYDMMASNYDANCTAAVLRITPKIDMNKIYAIIDNTPFLSDVRRTFYKRILQERKELIIDRAYIRCFYQEYDQDAIKRLNTGHQFSSDELMDFIRKKSAAITQYQECEKVIAAQTSREYLEDHILRGAELPSMAEYEERKRHLSEEYGIETEKQLYVIADIQSAYRNVQDQSLPSL